MYRFTVTGCHRRTAACHVTDPSMCYCIYCFIIVHLLLLPLTNKVSSLLLLYRINGYRRHSSCAILLLGLENSKWVSVIYIRTEDTFASLSSELGQQSWENVVNTNDANLAYDSFLNTFTTIFKKHCPVKKKSL